MVLVLLVALVLALLVVLEYCTNITIGITQRRSVRVLLAAPRPGDDTRCIVVAWLRVL